MYALLMIFLTACSTTTVDYAKDCDVRLEPLSPSEGAPDTLVNASVSPITTVWDTAVYMGNTRAEVVNVTREGCEECDACKERESCQECADCDACDSSCTDTCIESVQFRASSLAPGKIEVSIYNGHGQSNTQPFVLVGPTDTGTIDTGTVDSGGPEFTDTSAPSEGDTSEG